MHWPKGQEVLKERDVSTKACITFHSWSSFSLQLQMEKLLLSSLLMPDHAAMNHYTPLIFYISSSSTPVVRCGDSLLEPIHTLNFVWELNAILELRRYYRNENCYSILIKVKMFTYFSCFILSGGKQSQTVKPFNSVLSEPPQKKKLKW